MSQILYFTVSIPRERIGSTINRTDTFFYRRPTAYADLAGPCSLPSAPLSCTAGLPPAGKSRVGVISYIPGPDPVQNLSLIRSKSGSERIDLIVIPALGVLSKPVSLNDLSWLQEPPWQDLQRLLESNGGSLLVTTVRESGTGQTNREALVIIEKGKPPRIVAAIHGDATGGGTGNPPELVATANAQVALLTGRDFAFRGPYTTREGGCRYCPREL
jgi:hypothetical protein